MTTRAERTASVLRLLAEKLGLPEPPGRIEAYDISNTGASDIVAAMTVFADGKPKKSAYRYFLLRDLDGPDDYASMDQVISRRFKREIDGDERFARHPDLLLIDGGQTHAAVARRAMEQYGLDIAKQKISLAEPIKSYGSYEVKCKLGFEVSGTVYVLVIEEK